MTTAPSNLRVRVWVPQVWDMVDLDVTPEWTIAKVKVAALEQATGRTVSPARYEVKFRGALIADETQTLGDMLAPNGAPLIVLLTRRQPVR